MGRSTHSLLISYGLFCRNHCIDQAISFTFSIFLTFSPITKKNEICRLNKYYGQTEKHYILEGKSNAFSLHLCIYLSINLSIYLFIYISFHLYLSTYPSVYPSIHPCMFAQSMWLGKILEETIPWKTCSQNSRRAILTSSRAQESLDSLVFPL